VRSLLAERAGRSRSGDRCRRRAAQLADPRFGSGKFPRGGNPWGGGWGGGGFGGGFKTGGKF
jgi:hypothetical protein